MVKGFLALLLLVVGGCHSQPTNELAKNELDNKPEYSVLQAVGYEYRDVKNDKPYLVFKNALKTDATVVAFPIKNKTTGYVVMLAETKRKRLSSLLLHTFGSSPDTKTLTLGAVCYRTFELWSRRSPSYVFPTGKSPRSFKTSIKLSCAR